MRSLVLRATCALALLLLETPRVARGLDLPGALREVAAANPTLQGRRAMADAARARIAPAGAWPAPMLEVGAINVPVSGRFDMDPMTMKMVGISQRLPVTGALGLAKRSATAARNAEDADASLAHYEVLSQAWQGYADAYYASRLALAAGNHHAAMQQLVSAASTRYQSGSGRLEDLLRAQAEQARLLAESADMQAEATAARGRLEALLGREGATAGDTLAPPQAAPVPATPGPWLAAIDGTHPKLRALQARVDRWTLAGRSARRMAWPDLQAGFSYGVRGTVMGVKQDNMWTGTLGVMLPLFARSRELPMGAEMDAMARSAEADLREATLDLSQRLRATHARALAAQRRVGLYADTICVAQTRALAATWSAYTSGSSDLARVLEAMHAQYEDDIALERARQDLARTEGELVAILARGDVLGVTLPAPTASANERTSR